MRSSIGRLHDEDGWSIRGTHELGARFQALRAAQRSPFPTRVRSVLFVGLAVANFIMAVSCVAPTPSPPAPAAVPAAFPDAPVLPLVVLEAARPGPTVALVAGVHGGKVAAIRAIDSLRHMLWPALLRGRVMLVGPANLAGYQAGLAQKSPDDSLNLNRVFPGTVSGAPTERLAARIMREIVAKSDYLVDMHGSDGEEAVGRFAYAARPGLDLAVDSAALRLAMAWGVPIVVWDDAGPRTLATSRFLQTAAHLSGVPAITVFEAGATREDSAATQHFIEGAMALLVSLEMLAPTPEPSPPALGAASSQGAPSSKGAQSSQSAATRVLPRRAVTLAPAAGVWTPVVRAGATVTTGELLGTFNDSTEVRVELRAAASGVVLHQRLAGTVPSSATLIILGVIGLE